MKWKVKFVDRMMEPPYPFGKQEVIVMADNRNDAKRRVRDKYRSLISQRYKMTASPMKEGV